MRTLPARAVSVDRRSRAPISVLSRQIDEICTAAVDPLHIAAALEAAGYSDGLAQSKYGRRDVFDLAEEIFLRVPYRPRHVRYKPGWTVPQAGVARQCVRGVLFALPGLFYLVAARVVSSRAAILSLALSITFSWGWGQGMTALGYRLLGQGKPAAALRLQRRGLVLGVAAVGAVGALWWASTDVRMSAVIVPEVAVAYVLSAYVLLMRHRDRWLAVVLIPGSLISTAYLLGAPSVGLPVASAAVGCSVLASVVAAWISTRKPASLNDGALQVRRDDLVAAIPSACYGCVCSLLLFFGAVQRLFDGSRPWAGGFDFTILPLVLSMGVAEWQLYRYRRAVQALLAEAVDPDSFARQSWRLLKRVLADYCLGLVLLSYAVSVVILLAGGAWLESAVMMAAYCTLGAALFLGLLLVAAARIMPALICSTVALVLQVVAVIALGGRGLSYLQLLVDIGLLAALLVIAHVILTRVTAHWTLV